MSFSSHSQNSKNEIYGHKEDKFRKILLSNNKCELNRKKKQY